MMRRPLRSLMARWWELLWEGLMRILRIDTFRWAVGAYCAVFGAILLIAPHRFPALPFVPLQPELFWLGLITLLAGMLLIAAALRVPWPSLVVGAHLIAAAVITFVILVPLITAASWLGVTIYGVLALSTLLAPIINRARIEQPTAREGDLFALMMGVSTAMSGLLFLAVPGDYTAAFGHLAPYRSWFGGSFLASGLALVLIQFVPVERLVSVVVHTLSALILWIWLIALVAPGTTSGWNPHLYYGGFGLALALQPWLLSLLSRVDPAALGTRLALTFAALVVLPLIVVVALIADDAEQRETANALRLQRNLARGVAQDIASYVAFNRTAARTLASYPGLLELDPATQRAHLQALNQIYPDVFALQIADADGAVLARSDDLPPTSPRGFLIYEEARRTGRPAIDLLVSPTTRRPVLGFSVPILDSDGQFAGLVSGGLHLTRLSNLVIRAEAATAADAYVVDATGRVIADPDEAQIFADRATHPPVAALLRGPNREGTLRYQGEGRQQWLAGHAQVPDLDWVVVLERPLAEAVAEVRAGRELALATMALVTVAALGVGLLAARLLIRPLSSLVHAMNLYAEGNSSVPPPVSRVSEIAHLSATFALMRERLDQRTAENLRLYHEAQIQRSHYEVTLASIGDAVIATDTAGRVTFLNQVAVDVTGWSHDDAIGQPLDQVFQIVSEITGQQVESPFSKVMREGTVVGLANHTMLITRDGRQVPIADSGAPIRDASGQIVGIVLVFRDITEQKYAEERERRLNQISIALTTTLEYPHLLERLARLLVPDLADYCVIDAVNEGGYLQRVAAVYGDSAGGQLLQASARGARLHRLSTGFLEQVLRTGAPVLVREVDATVLRALEHEGWLQEYNLPAPRSLILAPLTARGRTLALLLLAVVEPGRHYNDADLALVRELSWRAGLATDNARLYNEAQEAIRVRDTFLSIAAHELRTPLTALLGQVQLMQRRAQRDQSLHERYQRSIDVVAAQALRLNQMVTALLDLSRLEQGRFTIERAPVDLCALARRLVDELQPALEYHTVECTTPEDTLFVEGDELRLGQVLQNLIQNAIKYSPDGGSVHVLLERRGNQVAIEVSDHGIGIPPEALPRLFRPFYRASNVEGQQIMGLGVGLYVVKEVVALHGGAISVASQEGQGSTFTITLPLMEQHGQSVV